MIHDDPFAHMRHEEKGVEFSRNTIRFCFCSLILVSIVVFSGCASPLKSPIASERIKGLERIMTERRIEDDDAKSVLDLLTDSDANVRIKAFDAFARRQLTVCPGYDHVNFDGGFDKNFAGKVLSILSKERDALVRKKMWKIVKRECESSVHKYPWQVWYSEVVMSSRFPDSLRKEYVQAFWGEEEFIRICTQGYGGGFLEKALEFVDSADACMNFMYQEKKNSPHNYYSDGDYKQVARRFAEIDQRGYVKYAIANSTDFPDVKVAVDVLNDEAMLTAIVLKGLKTVPKEYKSNMDVVLKRYLLKVNSESHLIKVIENVEMGASVAQSFLDSLNNEDILTRALSNSAVTDRVIDSEVLHRYVKRIQKDSNLKLIVARNRKLAFYALQEIKDQDYLYKILLKNQSKDVIKNMILGKLDDDHKNAYQKFLEAEKKAAWHKEFDPIIKSAQRGDVNAMRRLAEDAENRGEMETALNWYLKICDIDNDDGHTCIKVGDFYDEGLGTVRDLAMARKFYAMAIARGREEAKMMLNQVLIKIEHPNWTECALDYCSAVGFTPSKTSYYMYNGGRGFEKYKIFQVVPSRGGVLVQAAIFHDGLPEADRLSLKKNLLLIQTDTEYIDGDWLKKGIFIYVGRHVYTTVVGGSKAVHVFREWKPRNEYPSDKLVK